LAVANEGVVEFMFTVKYDDLTIDMSLRGALADEFFKLYLENPHEGVSWLRKTLSHKKDEILTVIVKGMVLVGYKKDRGQCHPDW